MSKRKRRLTLERQTEKEKALPLGPQNPAIDFPPADPGVLYRDCDPPAGHTRLYTVDQSGERVFEITVRKDLATPDLIDRWREDARAIAAPALFLVRSETVRR